MSADSEPVSKAIKMSQKLFRNPPVDSVGVSAMHQDANYAGEFSNEHIMHIEIVQVPQNVKRVTCDVNSVCGALRLPKKKPRQFGFGSPMAASTPVLGGKMLPKANKRGEKWEVTIPKTRSFNLLSAPSVQNACSSVVPQEHEITVLSQMSGRCINVVPSPNHFSVLTPIMQINDTSQRASAELQLYSQDSGIGSSLPHNEDTVDSISEETVNNTSLTDLNADLFPAPLGASIKIPESGPDVAETCVERPLLPSTKTHNILCPDPLEKKMVKTMPYKELLKVVLILNSNNSNLVPMTSSEIESFLIENDEFFNIHKHCGFWKKSVSSTLSRRESGFKSSTMGNGNERSRQYSMDMDSFYNHVVDCCAKACRSKCGSGSGSNPVWRQEANGHFVIKNPLHHRQSHVGHLTTITVWRNRNNIVCVKSDVMPLIQGQNCSTPLTRAANGLRTIMPKPPSSVSAPNAPAIVSSTNMLGCTNSSGGGAWATSSAATTIPVFMSSSGLVSQPPSNSAGVPATGNVCLPAVIGFAAGNLLALPSPLSVMAANRVLFAGQQSDPRQPSLTQLACLGPSVSSSKMSSKPSKVHTRSQNTQKRGKGRQKQRKENIRDASLRPESDLLLMAMKENNLDCVNSGALPLEGYLLCTVNQSVNLKNAEFQPENLCVEPPAKGLILEHAAVSSTSMHPKTAGADKALASTSTPTTKTIVGQSDNPDSLYGHEDYIQANKMCCLSSKEPLVVTKRARLTAECCCTPTPKCCTPTPKCCTPTPKCCTPTWTVMPASDLGLNKRARKQVMERRFVVEDDSVQVTTCMVAEETAVGKLPGEGALVSLPSSPRRGSEQMSSFADGPITITLTVSHSDNEGDNEAKAEGQRSPFHCGGLVDTSTPSKQLSSYCYQPDSTNLSPIEKIGSIPGEGTPCTPHNELPDISFLADDKENVSNTEISLPKNIQECSQEQMFIESGLCTPLCHDSEHYDEHIFSLPSFGAFDLLSSDRELKSQDSLSLSLNLQNSYINGQVFDDKVQICCHDHHLCRTFPRSVAAEQHSGTLSHNVLSKHSDNVCSFRGHPLGSVENIMPLCNQHFSSAPTIQGGKSHFLHDSFQETAQGSVENFMIASFSPNSCRCIDVTCPVNCRHWLNITPRRRDCANGKRMELLVGKRKSAPLAPHTGMRESAPPAPQAGMRESAPLAPQGEMRESAPLAPQGGMRESAPLTPRAVFWQQHREAAQSTRPSSCRCQRCSQTISHSMLMREFTTASQSQQLQAFCAQPVPVRDKVETTASDRPGNLGTEASCKSLADASKHQLMAYSRTAAQRPPCSRLLKHPNGPARRSLFGADQATGMGDSHVSTHPAPSQAPTDAAQSRTARHCPAGTDDSHISIHPAPSQAPTDAAQSRTARHCPAADGAACRHTELDLRQWVVVNDSPDRNFADQFLNCIGSAAAVVDQSCCRGRSPTDEGQNAGHTGPLSIAGLHTHSSLQQLDGFQGSQPAQIEACVMGSQHQQSMVPCDKHTLWHQPAWGSSVMGQTCDHPLEAVFQPSSGPSLLPGSVEWHKEGRAGRSTTPGCAIPDRLLSRVQPGPKWSSCCSAKHESSSSVQQPQHVFSAWGFANSGRSPDQDLKRTMPAFYQRSSGVQRPDSSKTPPSSGFPLSRFNSEPSLHAGSLAPDDWRKCKVKSWSFSGGNRSPGLFGNVFDTQDSGVTALVDNSSAVNCTCCSFPFSASQETNALFNANFPSQSTSLSFEHWPGLDSSQVPSVPVGEHWPGLDSSQVPSVPVGGYNLL